MTCRARVNGFDGWYKHIADEMDDRCILPEYIEAALAAPDHVTADPADPASRRSYKAIPAFANRVQRVVHRPAARDIPDGDVFVVTAHWDRGAKLP